MSRPTSESQWAAVHGWNLGGATRHISYTAPNINVRKRHLDGSPQDHHRTTTRCQYYGAIAREGALRIIIQVSILDSEVEMPISFPSLLLPKSSLAKPIHGARKRTPDPHIAPFYICHTGLPTTYGQSYPEDLLDLAIFADDQSQLSPLLLVKCTGP